MRQLLTSKGSNWAICLLSVSMMALAVSYWARPAPVSAQAPASHHAVTGESKAVLTALQDGFSSIADAVEPSVVTIKAEATQTHQAARPAPDDQTDIPEPFRDFFRQMPRGEGGPQGVPASTGSGIIIRESGNTAYVLTNNHVVEGRDRFRVTLNDSTQYHAELVGRDDHTDLAVLRVATRRPLSAGSVATLGNSDRVRVGQWAIAIGSPLGYESTLTVGVISAKGRMLDGLGQGASYSDLLQTDASINPGNSGGPLVNIDGDVVGINVAIAAPFGSQGSIGIGFAIPSNTARAVADQLISQGHVTRGYLGVAVSQDNRELAPELRNTLNAPNGGALAESVQPDTPAGRAGVKPGDVIVRYGDRDVHNFTDLEKAVASTRPGTSVPVEVIRDRHPVRLNITVVERPAEQTLSQRLRGGAGPNGNGAPSAQPVKSRYGLALRPADNGGGAQIATVAPGSPAFDAGLRPGDVILQVGDTATPTVQAFQKAIDSANADEGIVLRVQTSTGLRFVVLRP